MNPSSDIAFTPSVKALQVEDGSRDAYDGAEFETDVTDRLRAFLADIDTAFLATATRDGQPYIQHRGGTKGFIRALDDHTLAFDDYAGNRQYITAGNLTDNDRVCLFLIDYARRRRVKVWGTARVVRTADARRIEVTVRAWDINCPKHIPRKLDAEDVASTIARLEARIAELERR